MLDTERGVPPPLRPSPLAPSSLLLRTRLNERAMNHAPRLSAKRSQLPKATFHSPIATAPLEATTAGSKLPVCSSSASQLSTAPRFRSPQAFVENANACNPPRCNPKLRSSASSRLHSPSGLSPNLRDHHNHAISCRLLAGKVCPLSGRSRVRGIRARGRKVRAPRRDGAG
jgi:hypothetical protein